MLDEQRWNEVQKELRQRRRREWLKAIIENFPLFWVFDFQIHEIYRINMRETAQEYRRMKLRFFFSWEGLSKFLLTPVFKIGLTSVFITPILANIYISLRDTFNPFFDYKFPIQMALLFLSGLFFVIARVFYEVSCPTLVKAHINRGSLDDHTLQNKQWLQSELEHCLLQYVVRIPIAEDYIRGKKILIWHKKMSEGPQNELREEWKKKMQEGYEKQTDGSLELSLPISELATHRVGFDSYGLWLIEELLLRIAKATKHKLFSGEIKPKTFHEIREGHGALLHPQYHAVYHAIFELVSEYRHGPEKSTPGDLLLSHYETNHLIFDEFPKGASIHDYFHGISLITHLEADDVVREFIAENENYWNPFKRMTITFILMFSLIFLGIFLLIQTFIVGKAIYLSS